jgi:hypothetical protein
MLGKRQIGRLVALGAALWFLVALYIRLRPGAFLDPVAGTIAFLTAPIAGWLSVLLCRSVGKLSASQLLPGVTLVGAVAMMLDGAALRWFSGIYGFNERALHLGAAWLLWGYGVAFAVVLAWEGRLRRRSAHSGAGL